MEIEVGQSSSLTVSINNPGTSDLTVSALRVTSSEGAAFTLGSAPALPVVVVPGTAVLVEVVFHPTTVGAAKGTLQINSDAANTPEVTVALHGTAVAAPAPQIAVSTSALTFRDVEVGQSLSLTVSISNSGTTDLTLSALTVTSSEGTAFTLGSAPTLPVAVVPGSTVHVEVVYQPMTVGASKETLHINNDAGNTPEVTVDLHGTGVAPTAQIVVSPTSLFFGEVEVPVFPRTLE